MLVAMILLSLAMVSGLRRLASLSIPSKMKMQGLVCRLYSSSASSGHSKGTNHRGPKSRFILKMEKASDRDIEKDRPFTLPPGEFKPKQSLGQNFLSDQNYVLKIVDSFRDSLRAGQFSSEGDGGRRIVEIGPGPGALSRVLHQRYPNMTAIEVDQRAVAFLAKKIPGLHVINMDVLQTDWAALSTERAGRLSVVANLPYHIVSQVLFSLADSHTCIDLAVVTMQLEVAERMCARPGNKRYGIPSVVFQLYGAVKMEFKIPPSVFYPVPKVDSALVTMDFTQPHRDLYSVSGDKLRKVVTTAFRQRRKMLRQSLKEIISEDGLQLPERWAQLRPEQLKPEQFLSLTKDLYGPAAPPPAAPAPAASSSSPEMAKRKPVWRTGFKRTIPVSNSDDDDDDDDDDGDD